MKKKTSYKCSNCGYTSNGFFGKCPGCGEWNTLIEVDESPKSSKLLENKENARPLGEVQVKGSERVQTEIEEFNRVMGGGIVRDSISIITAKPGAGKSTLLLQVANDLATKGFKILYASGEESESQIRSRADRILANISQNLFVYSTNVMDYCLEEIDRIDPDFIIIDSIQTFILREIQS
ncbi:MAG: AAA family ATPase, partial [Peptoniphilus sp.]|uniref:AAA family ATPase n=1 Tax=Peptoniphilus sp. TaxID=1971214 RepID=UPI002A753B48